MNNSRKTKNLLRLMVIGACLLVAGCKMDLYTQLSEREANEMLAILVTNGISAQKEYVGDEGVTLRVEESHLARAIDILSENGFPRQQRDSIGQVFEKSGIMSSPFEEHVRYIYALGEEVSKTLSEIDGVLTARVHIVLPEDPSLGEEVKPSSAAVFIKHRRGVDLDFLSPQIRRLVSNSIEGVEYENVTMVLVAAEPPQVLGDQLRTPISELFPGFGVRSSDVQSFWQIIAGVAGVLVLLVIANLATLYAFLRLRGKAKQTQAEGDAQPALGE